GRGVNVAGADGESQVGHDAARAAALVTAGRRTALRRGNGATGRKPQRSGESGGKTGNGAFGSLHQRSSSCPENTSTPSSGKIERGCDEVSVNRGPAICS